MATGPELSGSRRSIQAHTSWRRGSRTSSSCRWPSIRSADRGATRSPPTTHRPRVSGSPDDLRYLIDHLHSLGIAVIVDWVPAHFPKDDWALARFDGTALCEHADPLRGEQLDWGTYVSTSVGTRCVTSWSPMPCSGSASSTSTVCVTRSPRCCISTIRARRASGGPTSTAAGRTSGGTVPAGNQCDCAQTLSRRGDHRRGPRPGRASPG